jgi:spore coat protein A
MIVARRNRPLKLKVINQIPARHILPVDPTVIDPAMGAETGGRTDRICVHWHGGHMHWQHDGGPAHWFSNPANAGGFVHGSSFINGAEPGAALYEYPNDQGARMTMYHDHAYGLTRTNVYAGLIAPYFITDDVETGLVSSGLLPSQGGAYPIGIPLVIQDKTFWDGGKTDPDYSLMPPAGATTGSLWYPYKYEVPPLPSMTFADPNLPTSGTGRWDNPGITTPPVSCVPEFFADTMLVNGAPYPTMSVDRRRYRFRILNGCGARFLNLQLYIADKSPDGITLASSPNQQDNNGNPLRIPTNRPGPRIIQIGNECGFLPQPVVLNDPPLPIGYKLTSKLGPADPTLGHVNRYNLLLAPAERADIIIDFREMDPGTDVILYNDAPAPFPGGDIRNDYFTGRPDLSSIGGAAPNAPGAGPETRVIMRFKVGAKTVTEPTLDATLSALRTQLPTAFASSQPATNLVPAGAPKIKTLNEDFDGYGRLRQMLGTAVPQPYLASPTEIAKNGDVQRWQIFNLTGDTHPIHIHLVNFIVRKRERWAFTTDAAGETIPLLDKNGNPQVLSGTAQPPDPNEAGWKETVRANPGEVLTIDMKFDLPAGTAPFSPRLQSSYGINGYEYAWHCHIVEHEEHDMMRPLVVV